VTRLAHERYVRELATESDRFLEVLRRAGPAAPVPTCPGWDVSDLLHHLTEVQDFWSLIASGRADDPEAAQAAKMPRADDHATQASRCESASAALRIAVGRAPATACWTWDDEDRTVGWVARRQAHEALIHRVDAEVAAGAEVRDAPPDLAADGIDELLRVFVGGAPDWGEFLPDGGVVLLEATDTGHRWQVVLGGLWGTSPRSGKVYEGLPMAEVDDDEQDEPDAVVRGRAWDLDRWLWGRGSRSDLDITGEPEVIDRLRIACEVQ
jgi:uncharacterized protein (TIGR03083 family)